MNSIEDRNLRLGFWAVLLFSTFAWAPAMYPGYWEGLEGFLPVFNVVQSAPIASVATSPDLWRGTGQAAFLLAQPLILLGLSPTAAVRAVFAVSIVLGGLGIYVWLNPRLGDRAAGLAGLIYMLWPPLLATVYVRGSLSDASVMALLPLALAGTATYSETRSLSAAGVVTLSVLWMWRTQAGLAVIATLILLLYVLVVERVRVTGLVVAIAGVAGLTSLMPIWSITSPAPIPFYDHFVYVHQLISGGWHVAPSVPGWQDQYPYQIGFAALAFVVVATWLWWIDRPLWRTMLPGRLFVFSLTCALTLTALSLPISAPLWRISGANRLLVYPWQIVLLAGPFYAAAGSLPAINPALRGTLLWTVLVGLTVLSSYPYLTTEFTQVQPPAKPRAVIGDGNELVLLEATLTEDVEADAARLDVMWQVLQPLTFDYNVFFQALTPAGDDLQVVSQLDAQPLNGEQPATVWRPGEIFTDTYRLDLSSDAGSSSATISGLRYYFGYYDWRDGTRLPVDGGIDDKLIFYGE